MDNIKSTDWENLFFSEEDVVVILYPNETNPLYKVPHRATYSGGYFLCHGSDPANGPDYYFRDVALYNEYYEIFDK